MELNPSSVNRTHTSALPTSEQSGKGKRCRRGGPFWMMDPGKVHFLKGKIRMHTPKSMAWMEKWGGTGECVGEGCHKNSGMLSSISRVFFRFSSWDYIFPALSFFKFTVVFFFSYSFFVCIPFSLPHPMGRFPHYLRLWVPYTISWSCLLKSCG